MSFLGLTEIKSSVSYSAPMRKLLSIALLILTLFYSTVGSDRIADHSGHGNGVSQVTAETLSGGMESTHAVSTQDLATATHQEHACHIGHCAFTVNRQTVLNPPVDSLASPAPWSLRIPPSTYRSETLRPPSLV